MPDPNREVGALIDHLRERDQRLEGVNERIASQLEKTAERLSEVASRVERMDERFEAHLDAVNELRVTVSGTAAQPGLTVRVDRIEQAILLFRWFFGGGLVAAGATFVLIWKFSEQLAKAP